MFEEKINTFLGSFDIEEYRNKQEIISDKQEELSQLALEIRRHRTRQVVEEKKVELLNQVPCGPEFSHCKFIRDAYTALESLGITKKEIDELSGKQGETQDALGGMEPDTVSSYLEKYEQVLERQPTLQRETSSWELEIAQNKTALVRLRSEIKNLRI